MQGIDGKLIAPDGKEITDPEIKTRFRMPLNREERRQRGHRGSTVAPAGELTVHAVRFSIDIMVTSRRGGEGADILARRELTKQLKAGNLRDKMFTSETLVPGGIQSASKKLEPVVGHLRARDV